MAIRSTSAGVVSTDMSPQTRKQLDQAKDLFYRGRPVEAYNILRRYFDRLPFKPEEGHAEFIGMFARTLVELGKGNDLDFYLSELERLHSQKSDPFITYQLAIVLSYTARKDSRPSTAQLAQSKQLFENLIRDPQAKRFQAKAKMHLANFYCPQDMPTVKSIIYSIGTPDSMDEDTQVLLLLWKALIFSSDKKYECALEMTTQVVENQSPDKNWYLFASAKITQAKVLMSMGDVNKAREIVLEMRGKFETRNFKSIQNQLEFILKQIQSNDTTQTVTLKVFESYSELGYGGQVIKIEPDSPTEALLFLLVSSGFLTTEKIVQALYKRSYEKNDDRMIYSHIHSVRKQLSGLGLPRAVVVNENNGYRFTSVVRKVESDR